MKTKKLQSIRTRLLVSNIGLVVIAFLAVIISFNVLMQRSINNGARAQLSEIVATEKTTNELPDLTNALMGSFHIHPVVFTISSSDKVTTEDNASSFEIASAKSIAAYFKAKSSNLSAITGKRFDISGNVYYITVVLSGTVHYVYYIDVTGIINFANNVSLYLIILALAVIVLSSLSILFVTRTITRPLSQLKDFAKRIGKGDFRHNDEDFRLREFAQLADNLNDTALQLDQVDKDQKIFFQNASHELRTPLMSIKSYAEGIKYDVMPAHESAEVILGESDRMAELVEDLLTISRLDSLEAPMEMKIQDCRELMQDIMNEQAALAKVQGLEFVAEFSEKPVMLEMNYKALRRAISNLTSNSLRYAKHKITLVCQNRLEGGILLAVKNDGEPISEKDQAHLFERFYKGKGGVHGIGLAIVKSIVEQHKGEIFVTSDEAETAFIMIFI